MYSGNQSFLKELNIISSIRIIRSTGLISRADLADKLGLNRSTITTIINELIEEELIEEVGIGNSKGGRPPKLLQFNSEAAYTICIDWTPEYIKIFISNLKGNIFFSKQVQCDINKEISQQINEIILETTAGLTNLPAKKHGLLGIGIGVPGIIDNDTVSSYDLAWDKVPLANYFSDAFDCPVIVENIANVGLTAEQYFGCAQGEENVYYLRLEKGISASLLYKDTIYRGSEGFVGYVGHSIIDVHGKKCVCGNRGCWQNYASENALIESYVKISNRNVVTMNEFIKLVKENDHAAVKAIHEFSEYLGIGISNIINMLNPRLIIIDCSLNEISNFIYRSLLATINKTALPYPKRNVKVLFSSLGEYAIVLGITALILDKVFTSPNVRIK